MMALRALKPNRLGYKEQGESDPSHSRLIHDVLFDAAG